MAAVQGQSRHHECALCLETLNSPRLLPCFHSFCVGCLQRLARSQARSGTFPCPSCRTVVTVPEGGVEKFQVNFYIQAEAEGLAEGARATGSSARDPPRRACEICRKDAATHRCAECEQLACDTCTAVHASFVATRSHTVLRLKKGQLGGHSGGGAVEVTKVKYCSTHKEEKIRFFCTPCSTVICRDCKLTSHERHATTDLSAKSSETKELLAKVTRLSRENLEPKLREQLREARRHQQTLKDQKRDMLALLEQKAGELKREIDKSLSQAKQQLDEETAGLDKTVATCVDSMSMELSAFLSLTEHVERVVEGGCEADILEMPRQMTDFFQGGGQQASTMADQPVTSFFCSSSARYSPYASVAQKVKSRNVGKLKSFAKTKWKAVVKMEDGVTKCGACGGTRVRRCLNCPSCKGSGNTMTAAAAQKAISDYMGRVTKAESEDVKRGGHQSAFQSTSTGFSFGFVPQPEPRNKPEGADLTSQIIEEVSSIQSCLSPPPTMRIAYCT